MHKQRMYLPWYRLLFLYYIRFCLQLQAFA
nr:MAG TPA: hypothetical protein [Caudoviricetes sp.]